jgi:hypothetical protein
VVARVRADASDPDADDVLVALAALHELLDDLRTWEPLLIEAARAQGVSWSALAPVLGVTSRQAAERRYLRMRPHRDSTLTGEQRVQDTRDSRIGERAVAEWARDHAAELRELAARVSAATTQPPCWLRCAGCMPTCSKRTPRDNVDPSTPRRPRSRAGVGDQGRSTERPETAPPASLRPRQTVARRRQFLSGAARPWPVRLRADGES